MIFFTVFIVSFMSADYLITGSVTNTWIGFAILFGIVSGMVRRLVLAVLGDPAPVRQNSSAKS